MKIAVIGAGASGIIASLVLSKKNEVLLLEKDDKIGKKILVTGNGKCNLWNLNILRKENINEYYYTDNYDKLNSFFSYKNKVYQYITSDLGIFVKDKDNYVYPYSKTANSVRETLEKQILKNNNIDLVCNYNVTRIEKEDNKFKVYSNSEYYTVDKVILSVGYKSSNLGTNSLETLLKDTEVIVNEPYPALVPITIDSPYLKRWNGIRTDAKLTLLKNNEIIKSDVGELQLTDYGLSGIVSLNLSSYINRNIDNNLELEIDFMPDTTLSILFDCLSYTDETLEEVFETLFNYKLMFIIFDEAALDKNKKWNDLTIEEKNTLIKTINHFKVNVTGTLSYDRSQVTTGGISLNEVSNSLELNKIEGMYAAGEILDIDGICGGFNLANAFITGYIIGESINDKN